MLIYILFVFLIINYYDDNNIIKNVSINTTIDKIVS